MPTLFLSIVVSQGYSVFLTPSTQFNCWVNSLEKYATITNRVNNVRSIIILTKDILTKSH